MGWLSGSLHCSLFGHCSCAFVSLIPPPPPYSFRYSFQVCSTVYTKLSTIKYRAVAGFAPTCALLTFFSADCTISRSSSVWNLRPHRTALKFADGPELNRLSKLSVTASRRSRFFRPSATVPSPLQLLRVTSTPPSAIPLRGNLLMNLPVRVTPP